MKQIIQNFKSGKINLKELPTPIVREGGVLVQNKNSLISIGTEKLMLDLARKNIVGKAIDRPDQVKQVIEKVKKEGIKTTYQKVMNKLEDPKPLGYSCSGIVIGVGKDGGNFQVGDRVACAGAGYASHAEIIFVPKNLTVKIPQNISFEEAAYTTLGAIALQGVRQAEPRLGDIVFVMGLGLLGLITVQLLKANGCLVIGSDIDNSKIKLAKELGADHAVQAKASQQIDLVRDLTLNQGVDAVIITASSKSNEPIELSAELTRQKGKVIAVGMIPMNVPRNAFYLKELDLRLSMSYGPGRYDPFYEELGRDYPYAYVRWTEQRNMQAVLNLMVEGKLNVNRLTSHKYKFNNAEDVYNRIVEAKEKYLGVLFEYDKKVKASHIIKTITSAELQQNNKIGLGLIGAGNYAAGVLYPEVTRHDEFKVLGLATASGISAEDKGKKYSAEIITTDYKELLKNKHISTVFITTRHNMHAEQVIQSLKAKKHVFVEKPLALSISELESIKKIYNEGNNILFVGYNRRYSPLAVRLKDFLKDIKTPLNIIYRINAGFIPKNHWIQDPGQGGGRIIGEVCHFIDFLIYLTNSLPAQVYTTALALNNTEQVIEDNISAVFKFRDGSTGTIIYSAQGASVMEKEYLEVFANNKSTKLLDFIELSLYYGHKKRKIRQSRQDKGQAGEIEFFKQLVLGKQKKSNLFEEIYFGALATYKVLESLRTGKPVNIES